ncbi:MAG: calcium-binding protein [Actinomycetota bacterium]
MSRRRGAVLAAPAALAAAALIPALAPAFNDSFDPAGIPRLACGTPAGGDPDYWCGEWATGAPTNVNAPHLAFSPLGSMTLERIGEADANRIGAANGGTGEPFGEFGAVLRCGPGALFYAGSYKGGEGRVLACATGEELRGYFRSQVPENPATAPGGALRSGEFTVALVAGAKPPAFQGQIDQHLSGIPANGWTAVCTGGGCLNVAPPAPPPPGQTRLPRLFLSTITTANGLPRAGSVRINQQGRGPATTADLVVAYRGATAQPTGRAFFWVSFEQAGPGLRFTDGPLPPGARRVCRGRDPAPCVVNAVPRATFRLDTVQAQPVALGPGPYPVTRRYRVTARDAAGTLLAASNTLEITWTAPPLCYGVKATIHPDPERPSALVIVGTPGRDVIVGTERDDVIHGDAGEDRICGLGGDDTIFGEEDSDVVFGGGGNDRIHGGADIANDFLNGEGDIDLLVGGRGEDQLSGGTGRDTLSGGRHDDVLHGGPDGDDIDGGNGDSDVADFHFEPGPVRADLAKGTASGGDVLTGIEWVVGTERGDIIFGDEHGNRLIGLGGGDLLVGRGGRDDLRGLRGADALLGGDEIDFLHGDNDDRILDGGPGYDYCTVDPAPTTVNCEYEITRRLRR